MMNITKKIIIIFLFITNVFAFNYPVFTKYYNTNNKKNILIISGVHGDEPGGYVAGFYLSRNLKIFNSKYNIYIIPLANLDGILNNKRSLYKDFNNLFGYKTNNPCVNFIERFLDYIKPKYVLSLHSGYSKTFGNKIIIDEKKYKNINLYDFIYPIYLKSRRYIKNLKIYISHTIKNRYAYNQDNFHDLSWYCLSRYHTYFYTIESTKEDNISEQVFNHLIIIKYFFQKLNIKTNIDSLIDLKKIKKFIKINKKTKLKIFLSRNFLKMNKDFLMIESLNKFIFIYKNKIYFLKTGKIKQLF